MTTQIEVFRSGSWESIQYSDFEIELGVSEVKVAPTATVTTHVNESLSAGQDARIVIDNTVRFQGWTNSPGTARENGQVNVALDHPASELWETQCDVDLTSPTDEEVLQQALTNANTEESYTLNYVGTATNLDNDYSVENRAVKSIWRDMVDRTDRVWWCDPANTTITVAPRGNGGQWNALDAQADRISVQSFDEGSVDTVRNVVTVIGTGEVKVENTSTDTVSINEYGRHEKTYNLSYVTTPAEAAGVSLSLLQPDPIPEGRVAVGTNVGTIDAPLVNQTIDLTDSGKNINATGLVIERQVIEQGRATLHVGGGTAASVAEHNRQAKSAGDVTEPGSVYGSDRIADSSIVQDKIDDFAITAQKIADNAVENRIVLDSAITETKIDDDSISTPKLQAEAVETESIAAGAIVTSLLAANAITVGKFDPGAFDGSNFDVPSTGVSITSEGIGTPEIATQAVTANEIDALDVSAQDLQIVNSNGDGGEFNVSGGSVVYEPTPGGSVGFGSASNRIGTSFFDDNDVNSLAIGQFAGNGTIPVNPVPFDVGSDSGQDYHIKPDTDNSNFVGKSGNAFNEMHAYAFIDADTGSEISDGGDPLARLERGVGIPDHAKATDDDGEVVGTDISSLSRTLWDICEAQQEQIDDLKTELNDLRDSSNGTA